MEIKSKTWLIIFLISFLFGFIIIILGVSYIDPFFHYHYPYIDKFYYVLNNERSQNDGISKRFNYNALITGTSMTENFRASEMDKLFGVKSIKVPYSGGLYKEINDNIRTALEYNPNLKTVVRSLDNYVILLDKDAKRNDLGEYPTYLYDKNLFNDVKYIFNRDVLYSRCWNIVKNYFHGQEGGITNFDDYAYWMPSYTFGAKTVLKDDKGFTKPKSFEHLNAEEKKIIYDNITQNVTDTADEYPDVQFYYFFPPHSAIWWRNEYEAGLILKDLEIEQYAIELILPHKNIHLFSWSNDFKLLTDLNNYKDYTHYGEWINSWMLVQMKTEKSGLLTFDNYKKYIETMRRFYLSYDYSKMKSQQDYADDYYAEALYQQEIYGTVPRPINKSEFESAEYKNAQLVFGQHNLAIGIECHGTLAKKSEDNVDIADYLRDVGYNGAKLSINKVDDYNYLTFWGRKVRNNGQPTVVIYDKEGNKLREKFVSYQDLDNEWQVYCIDIKDISGNIDVIFNGGYVDNTGDVNSDFIFSDIVLY